jgi:hypothetical protein
LCRRAAACAEKRLIDRASRRFDALALGAIARVFARESALKVAADGIRWIVGAGGVAAADLAGLQASTATGMIFSAQAGLVADMDAVADVLYGRAKTAAANHA